jgi:uncharacterized protein (UPF0335 family)
MPASAAVKISQGTTAQSFAKDRLKSLVDRIERLEGEKAELAGDIRDIYAEAKASGFDVRALRQIISLRKIDSNDLAEREEILELYKTALGMA